LKITQKEKLHFPWKLFFKTKRYLPKTINAFYFFTFPKFFIFTHKFKYAFIFSFIKLFLQGVLIHASVRRTLIYKFQSEIKEDKVYTIQSFSVSCNGGSYRTTNHAYKINFQFGTKVNMVESTLVPKTTTSYTPFSTIIAAGFDTDYLVSKYIFLIFLSFFV